MAAKQVNASMHSRLISRVIFNILSAKASSLFIILLICSCKLTAQSLSPAPDPAGTRFFFRDTTGKIHSVSIAGSFNEWDKKRAPMKYDSLAGYWTGTVTAAPGIEYHYKLVLNDSLWITDPNAPDVTEDEWRNSIIIPQEYGKPYILYSHPPLNKRIVKAENIIIKLASPNGPINNQSVKLKYNSSKQSFSYDIKSQTITFNPNGALREGENKIELTFSDSKGFTRNNAVIKFFYDTGIESISTPRYFDTSVVCEIFIRSFLDSNNDGIGDFKGLTGKLGYLKDTLGINVLWLMPFQESTTEHGYNVVDYYSIEKDYGTMDDYLQFIHECKKRGIKVLLDFVINHTDSTHPFFLQAYKNPASKYSSWYQFTNKQNTDWYHFGVERKMPKLDFENDEVRRYFIKAAEYWLDPNRDGRDDDGVDGFRCDAAKEVPHSFWNLMRKEIKRQHPDAMLLGEVWDNANYVIPFFKNEFDALFNYPLLYSLDEFINNNNLPQFINRNMEFASIYPAGYQMVNFLANHDNHRAADRYNNEDKLRMALFTIFTLPGTPMIYYGDEIGMHGKLPPENVRGKFDWTRLAAEMEDQSSLFNHYKSLIALRRNNPVLSSRHDRNVNSLKFVETGSAGVLAYYRYDENSKYLALINNSGQNAVSISVPYPFSSRMPTQAECIFGNKNISDKRILLQTDNDSIIFGSINLPSNNVLLIKLH